MGKYKSILITAIIAIVAIAIVNRVASVRSFVYPSNGS